MGKGSALRIGLAGILSAAFTALTPAAAQTTPLFADDSEIAFTLEAPFSTLIRSARRSTDPHPATFSLTAGAAPVSYPLEISARGRTRRVTHCAFPPLRLDFDKDALDGGFLDGQNRLKLVTHCQPRAASEQLVVLEYTAYRLYNAITPQSFRVRPARVTYRDNEGRRDEETRFAFLIEDADDAARRNTLDEVEVASLAGAQLDAEAGARFALFEYMIGNLDWSFQNPPQGDDQCCHNSKLISAGGETRGVIPMPYDFDNSGFVSAPYGIPPEGYGDNVRIRHWRGLCAHNSGLPAAIALFQSRRTALEGVISGEARLSEPNRRRTLAYLGAFFETIGDAGAVEREIVADCRGG